MSGTHKGYEKPAGAHITRIGTGDPGIEAKLQRLIRDTGCTVTEVFTAPDGAKVCTIICYAGSDHVSAIRRINFDGYRVNAIYRNRS